MATKGLSSRLRDRVTIEERLTEPNGQGGRKAVGWVPVITVFAEVIALRGGEALTNSVQRGTQLWRITIRKRAGVTTAHRLRWGEIALDIKSAAPSDDRAALVMTCESGRAA